MFWREPRQCATELCTPLHTLGGVQSVQRVCKVGKRNEINGLDLSVQRCAKVCKATGKLCTHPLSPLGEGCKCIRATFWSRLKMAKRKNRKSRIQALAEMTERATAAAERARADAVERRRKVSQANQAKLTEWHAARRAERQRQLAEANRAARIAADPTRKDRRRVASAPGWRIVLERMEQGRWYGRAEIVALGSPDYAVGSVEAWLAQKLLAGGLVERAPNADFDATVPDRRQTEPMWLYRRVIPAAPDGAGDERTGSGVSR